MFMRYSFLLGILFTLSGPAFSQSQRDSLDLALTELYARSPFPGFAVALVHADSVLFLQGYGYADKAAATPYTAETIQNIGSVSKTFIGVAMMKALEQGLLSLDTPVNEYLPFRVFHSSHPGAPITLRHLATHTSGILDRHEVYKKSYVRGERANQTMGQFLEAYLSHMGAHYKRRNFVSPGPGEGYHYSNIGATLAAFVVEEASGMPFNVYTRQYLLSPMGMTDSGWAYETIPRQRHATLYSPIGKKVNPYTLVTYPDGGLRTSCKDLSRYLVTIMNGGKIDGTRILPAALVDTLLCPQFNPDSPPQFLPKTEPNQGLFWTYSRRGHIGHTGSDPGVTAFLSFDPETRQGRIFMTNMEMKRKHLKHFLPIWQSMGQHLTKMVHEYERETSK